MVHSKTSTRCVRERVTNDELHKAVANERNEKQKQTKPTSRSNERKPPSRYYFIYKTKVKNNHTAAITQIDWDYVFFERDTENEVGRQEFTSDEQIGPGKTKELTVTVTSPPTRTVSITSLNLEERDRFTEKIVLLRVKYADGRVWQAQ